MAITEKNEQCDKKRIIPMLNRTILQGYMVCLTQTVFAKLKQYLILYFLYVSYRIEESKHLIWNPVVTFVVNTGIHINYGYIERNNYFKTKKVFILSTPVTKPPNN